MGQVLFCPEDAGMRKDVQSTGSRRMLPDNRDRVVHLPDNAGQLAGAVAIRAIRAAAIEPSPIHLLASERWIPGRLLVADLHALDGLLSHQRRPMFEPVSERHLDVGDEAPAK